VKGLVLKDIYNLGTTWKTMAAMAVFYLAYGFMMNSGAMIGMFVMIFSLQVVSAFTYDKLSGFESYAMTLCVTRRRIVRSRYMTGLMLLFTAGVFATISGFVLLAFGKYEGGITELFAVIAATMSVGLLYDAAILPLVYKFGVEKSRIMMFALFALPVILVMLLDGSGIQFSESEILTGIFALPVAACIAYFFSYTVSQRIYASREM
jgi:hypothetical protein